MKSDWDGLVMPYEERLGWFGDAIQGAIGDCRLQNTRLRFDVQRQAARNKTLPAFSFTPTSLTPTEEKDCEKTNFSIVLTGKREVFV
jgi:hypothetical protein